MPPPLPPPYFDPTPALHPPPNPNQRPAPLAHSQPHPQPSHYHPNPFYSQPSSSPPTLTPHPPQYPTTLHSHSHHQALAHPYIYAELHQPPSSAPQQFQDAFNHHLPPVNPHANTSPLLQHPSHAVPVLHSHPQHQFARTAHRPPSPSKHIDFTLRTQIEHQPTLDHDLYTPQRLHLRPQHTHQDSKYSHEQERDNHEQQPIATSLPQMQTQINLQSQPNIYQQQQQQNPLYQEEQHQTHVQRDNRTQQTQHFPNDYNINQVSNPPKSIDHYRRPRAASKLTNQQRCSSPAFRPQSFPCTLSSEDVKLISNKYSDVLSLLRDNDVATQWFFQWILQPNLPNEEEPILDFSRSKGFRTMHLCASTGCASNDAHTILQKSSTMLLPSENHDSFVLGYFVETTDGPHPNLTRIGKYVYNRDNHQLLRVSKVCGPLSDPHISSVLINKTAMFNSAMVVNDYVMASFPSSPVLLSVNMKTDYRVNVSIPPQYIVHSRSMTFRKLVQATTRSGLGHGLGIGIGVQEVVDASSSSSEYMGMLDNSFFSLGTFGIYDATLVPCHLPLDSYTNTPQRPHPHHISSSSSEEQQQQHQITKSSFGQWALPDHCAICASYQVLHFGLLRKDASSLRTQFVREFKNLTNNSNTNSNNTINADTSPKTTPFVQPVRILHTPNTGPYIPGSYLEPEDTCGQELMNVPSATMDIPTSATANDGLQFSFGAPPSVTAAATFGIDCVNSNVQTRDCNNALHPKGEIFEGNSRRIPSPSSHSRTISIPGENINGNGATPDSTEMDSKNQLPLNNQIPGSATGVEDVLRDAQQHNLVDHIGVAVPSPSGRTGTSHRVDEHEQNAGQTCTSTRSPPVVGGTDLHGRIYSGEAHDIGANLRGLTREANIRSTPIYNMEVPFSAAPEATNQPNTEFNSNGTLKPTQIPQTTDSTINNADKRYRDESKGIEPRGEHGDRAGATDTRPGHFLKASHMDEPSTSKRSGSIPKDGGAAAVNTETMSENQKQRASENDADDKPQRKALPTPTKSEIIIRNRISAQRSNEKRKKKIEETRTQLNYLKMTYLPHLEKMQSILKAENEQLRLKFLEKYQANDICSFYY